MSNEQSKASPQLAPDALQPLEAASNRHDALVGHGIAPEQCLNPAFWAHHGAKMKPWDEVRVRCEDGSWMGYYVVLDSSRTWVKMQCLAVHKLTSADVSLSQVNEKEVQDFIAAHTVMHRGPRGWSVVRNQDRAILREGEEQKASAVLWLETHARVQVGNLLAAEKAPVTS